MLGSDVYSDFKFGGDGLTEGRMCDVLCWDGLTPRWLASSALR